MPFKYYGGVHPDYAKTASKTPVRPIAPPKQVVLPMVQHIGAPDQPTVKVGDTLTFTLDAYADREYTGQVTEILPLGVEMQNATYYEVRLTISNAQDLLPGMSGTLYIS